MTDPHPDLQELRALTEWAHQRQSARAYLDRMESRIFYRGALWGGVAVGSLLIVAAMLMGCI